MPRVVRENLPGSAATRCWTIWAEIFEKWPNSVDFVMGRVGMVGEGLDPLAKHQIHGPKQPNLTRSNKLQEKICGHFCGDFRIWTKNNKIKLANGGIGLQDVNKPCSDTKML